MASAASIRFNPTSLSPEEEGEAADLGGELGEIGVGRILREQLESRVHARQAVAEAAEIPHALCSAC